MKIKLNTGWLMIATILTYEVAFPQLGTGNEPSREIGARATALAGALASEAADASCMYWNPAALVGLDKASVLSDYYRSSAEPLWNESLSAVFRPTNDDGFGLGLSLGIARLDNQSTQSDLYPLQYSADFAYARVITSYTSIGVRAGLQYGHNEKSHMLAGSAAVGLFYFPSPEISYGIVYSGLGTGISYVLSQQSVVLAQEQLPQALQIGVSMRFPALNESRSLVISLANEKIITESGLLYEGGIEIFLLRGLALRIGYMTGLGISEMRYGFGLIGDKLMVDYAITPAVQTSRLHQVSVSMAF